MNNITKFTGDIAAFEAGHAALVRRDFTSSFLVAVDYHIDFRRGEKARFCPLIVQEERIEVYRKAHPKLVAYECPHCGAPVGDVDPDEADIVHARACFICRAIGL